MNWDYIIGFFDGEGSISLTRQSSNGNKTSQLSFCNNEIYVLEQIEAFIRKELNITGFIVTKRARKETHNTNYALQYNHLPKCLLIAKYLKSKHSIKSKRLRMLIQINEVTPRNGKYTKEQLIKRNQLIKEFYSY